MHLATLVQSVETLNVLIKAGARVNTKDDNGRTPLHDAVTKRLSDSELIKILMQVSKSNKITTLLKQIFSNNK